MRAVCVAVAVTVCGLASASDDRPEFASSKAGEEREVAGVKLCWCPVGKFTMGSPADEPERRPGEDQVEVTFARGFWVGKYEVTQGQWAAVVRAFPRKQPPGEGADFPVVDVNYAEAEGFCEWLTATGRKSGALPKGWEFRLPTEAQWEYACRAGTTTATSFGDTLSSKQANFKGKPYNGAEDGPSRNKAAKVGSYPANAWGVHDMHGNVFEWCRDWYHDKHPGGTDPDLSAAKGAKNRDGTYSRSRRGVGRRRVAVPVGVPGEVRAGPDVRSHCVPGRRPEAVERFLVDPLGDDPQDTVSHAGCSWRYVCAARIWTGPPAHRDFFLPGFFGPYGT